MVINLIYVYTCIQCIKNASDIKFTFSFQTHQHNFHMDKLSFPGKHIKFTLYKPVPSTYITYVIFFRMPQVLCMSFV